MMRQAAATMIRWEWLVLLLLLPLFLFPTGWQGLVLLIIPLFWFLRKFAFGYFYPHTAYDVTLFFLLTALLISLSAVFDMSLSFVKIAGLIFGIAVFYAGIQYTRLREAGRFYLLGLFIMLSTAMVATGVMGTLQSPFFAFLTPIVSLAPGSLAQWLNILPSANPNELAGILSWVVPLLLACTVGFWRLLWRSDRTWHRFLLLVMFLLLILNVSLLVASRSRGGLLALTIATLIMLAIRFRWGRWLLLMVIISGVALSFYLDLGEILQGNAAAGVDFGLQGRLEIWSRALYGLADFPYTGMSMNGFRYVVHKLYPLFSIAPDVDIAHAHNHLLQAGLDLGIPGLIAYLGIWIVSAALLWLGWRCKGTEVDRVLIIGLSGALVAGWVFGMLDTIALGARPGFLWWMLLALLAAVFEQVVRSGDPQETYDEPAGR